MRTCHELAHLQRRSTLALDKDIAVDLRRIRHGTRYRHAIFFVNLVHQHRHLATDFFLQTRRGNLGGQLHETLVTLLLHLFRHRVGNLVGFRAFHRRVRETTDAIEIGLFQPVEQLLELRFGFTREADNERGTNGEIRTNLAPFFDTRQRVLGMRRTLHARQHRGTAVLETEYRDREGSCPAPSAE
jgi:hypothetical protein